MKKTPTILVIDNFDSFTFNLVEYFLELGCRVETRRNTVSIDVIEKINPDFLVISPGPSVPQNAGNLMAILQHFHEKLPILGVCLGHEALIEAFGGTLQLVPPVHGRSSPIAHDGKTIFKNLPENFAAGRYHSLAGAEIPKCFEISARSDGLVMGIRHKTLPLEGVQFHPESVLTMRGGNGLQILRNFLHAYS